MATSVQNIQIRQGTAADFAAFIPKIGEPCYVTDTEAFFIGDGVSTGAELTTAGSIGSALRAGALLNSRLAKSAAYTVVAADKGKVIDATGTWTLSLTAAATLGDGFQFAVFNSGSGVITIDPASTETIKDAVSSATTKTLAEGEGGFIFCDGTGFKFYKVTIGAQTLSSLGAIFNTREAKSGAYTVVAGDKGKLFEATGTWSLSLTAAATLGDNFVFSIFNSGSGTITIDPDGAETIRDAAGSAATKTLTQGESAIIICNGTSFLMMKIVADTTGGGGGGAISSGYSAKTGAYTIVLGDKGYIIEATSGTWTLSLTAAATLGAGFACIVSNVGSGTITIDADSAETIRDLTSAATTKTLTQGQAGILYCDGTNFFLFRNEGTGGSSAPTTATSTSTGNQDNFNFSNADVLFFNNATVVTLRGLVAGVDGQVLEILAKGAGPVYLNNEDTNSTAANRILTRFPVTSNSLVIASGGSVSLIYDGTAARWVVKSYASGIPSGPLNYTELRRAADQTAATATATFASFDTEDSNLWGVFSSGNPTRITIPTGQGGLWQFGIHFFANQALTGQVQFGCRVNGSTFIFTQDAYMSGSTYQQVISFVKNLAAGDYIEFYYYQASGSDKTFRVQTFTACRIA